VESKTLKYRPYLDILMRKLESNFEIVAFCTGTQQYAHLMAKQIEKTNHYFSYVLSEQHIIRDCITPMKDLIRLGRDMNRVVAVDCRPQHYRNFKMHGVEVR
jgi:TFIIF-interacting CTD phosphatase-like protein